MRVTLLSKYSRLGASSRLRSLQYVPCLAADGFDIQCCPLFDDDYLMRLYGGDGRSLSASARRCLSRIGQLREASGSALLWLEYEALPYCPAWIERFFMPAGVPYIVDYDDAVFHNYDLSKRKLVRAALSKKIDHVMAGAACVIAGNEYLAERARSVGARKVKLVPTVVDSARYKVVDRSAGDSVVIGWIGSPSTEHYLRALAPAFERLQREWSIRLRLVGASSGIATEFGDLDVQVVPWSEETEAELVAGFDIGIMPLEDGPWERGKCGYKLIQYMACGRPVVASPVGVNETIVEGSGSGLLASGVAEWAEALRKLIGDHDLRTRLGLRGRRAVEEHYSLQAQLPVLADILTTAAQSGTVQ